MNTWQSKDNCKLWSVIKSMKKEIEELRALVEESMPNRMSTKVEYECESDYMQSPKKDKFFSIIDDRYV